MRYNLPRRIQIHHVNGFNTLLNSKELDFSLRNRGASNGEGGDVIFTS